MGAIASLITSLTIVYSAVYSDADQSKHQSSASLAFVWGIHRGPVNSPHKWPVTRKMFPFDDVIMSIFEADIDSEKLRWMLSPTQRNIYSIKNLTVKIFIIAISPVLSICPRPLLLREAKLLYQISGTGSQKCLHPVAYHFLTLYCSLVVIVSKHFIYFLMDDLRW